MLSTLRLIIVTLGGVLLGLGSAWWAVGHLQFEGARTIGQWSLLGDSATGNPYEAARAARRGGGGLDPSEGVELITEVTGEGEPFHAACSYVLAGAMPQGVLWTLAVSDREGRLSANPANRVGFTSQDALAYGTGRQVHITFGRDAHPGDFVPTTGLSSLRFTLRLYSPTVATRLPTPEQLPTVTALPCDSERRS